MHLTAADYERVVEASWALGACATKDMLTAAALQSILEIIGADESVANALNLDTGLVTADAYPDIDLAPDLRAQLADVLDDHPVVAHLTATQQVIPARMSDMMPFRRFERTRTYEQLFEPRALRHQLVIPLEVRES